MKYCFTFFPGVIKIIYSFEVKIGEAVSSYILSKSSILNLIVTDSGISTFLFIEAIGSFVNSKAVSGLCLSWGCFQLPLSFCSALRISPLYSCLTLHPYQPSNGDAQLLSFYKQRWIVSTFNFKSALGLAFLTISKLPDNRPKAVKSWCFDSSKLASWYLLSSLL